MKVSGRESVLLLATIAALLFGVTVMKARDRIEVWKGLRVQQADLRDSIARDLELADARVAQVVVDKGNAGKTSFPSCARCCPSFPPTRTWTCTG